MQYKLLASDFDNTLVAYGEKCPRPEVVAAVKKMQAAGGRFVLSTGRTFATVKPAQLGGIRCDYMITCNGAFVADRNGSCVASHPLTNEEMYALVNYCEDYEYPIQFAFRDGYYAYVGYETLNALFGAMPDAGFFCMDGEDRDRHLIDMPFAAFALMTEEGMRGFEEKYGYLGLHIMQVGPASGGLRCYDIVRGGMDKAVGLRDLCAAMDIPVEQSVAAGDSANDCGMLRAAGLGVCMDNGTADAKQAADRVIGDVRECGLAALIEELWFDGPKASPSGADLGDAWGGGLPE